VKIKLTCFVRPINFFPLMNNQKGKKIKSIASEKSSTEKAMKPIAVIFGANGMIGRYATRHFARKGYEVVAVARKQQGCSGDGMFVPWNGHDIDSWALALEGADVVLNLAGRSVNCRYNETNRRDILNSRVDSTRAIGKAIAGCKVAPRLWMNMSTATIYIHSENHPQDEWSGEPGDDFSMGVARSWEEEFFRSATPAATRKVALRTGIVLANEPGSAFDVLLRMVRTGLGGSMGSGKQKFSWIHMGDFLAALDHLIADSLIDGVINLTSPGVSDNQQLMQTLREKCAMPVGLPAPRWMVEIGAWLMNTESELVLKSRYVEPARLRDEGFRWAFHHLDAAVEDLMERRGIESFFRMPKHRPLGVKAWA
jgi:uncharacterized protein (TIGR01777 family)